MNSSPDPLNVAYRQADPQPENPLNKPVFAGFRAVNLHIGCADIGCVPDQISHSLGEGLLSGNLYKPGADRILLR